MQKKTLALLVLLFALLLPVLALADVVINEENFPDPGFRAYLMNGECGIWGG